MGDRELILFEEHKKLVGYIIFKHFDKYREIYKDELYDEGYCLLWQAIAKYKEGKAKLSTYAYIIIYRGLQQFLDNGLGAVKITRKRTKEDGNIFTVEDLNTKSLDFELSTSKDNDSKRSVSLIDKLGYSDKGFEDVDYNLYIDTLVDYFKKMGKHKRIYQDTDRIFLLMLDKRQKQEICQETNHEHRFVTRRMEIIKKDVKMFVEGGILIGFEKPNEKIKKAIEKAI